MAATIGGQKHQVCGTPSADIVIPDGIYLVKPVSQRDVWKATQPDTEVRPSIRSHNSYD